MYAEVTKNEQMWENYNCEGAEYIITAFGTVARIAKSAIDQLKADGKLNDLDESEEINACSVKIKVDVAGKEEDWILMFKNETHNHPTEIEPFGGAATCLGGAIRDPLSGLEP